MITLGIAHGWSGLLFALLRWGNATGGSIDPIVMTRLEELAFLAEPHAGGVRWPLQNSNASSVSFMEGWCNGTAGHAMLFALASQIYRNNGFAELAERAVASAWSSEMRYGTLCCGLAGIGYALLAVQRVTGSDDRARSLARRAAADSSKHSLRDAFIRDLSASPCSRKSYNSRKPRVCPCLRVLFDDPRRAAYVRKH
jgi:eukaryotic-like serine/threonine-protein kinase